MHRRVISKSDRELVGSRVQAIVVLEDSRVAVITGTLRSEGSMKENVVSIGENSQYLEGVFLFNELVTLHRDLYLYASWQLCSEMRAHLGH